jgi:hypothetical protein
MPRYFTALLPVLICAMIIQARADFTLTWTNCPNHMAGSQTLIWIGNAAPLNYSKAWIATGGAFTVKSPLLANGINYFACQQVATNADGTACGTAMSGEIQVMVNPAVAVDVAVMASTNLGQGWAVAASQTYVFPTGLQQQQFFKSMQRARATNVVVLPPMP